jgi:hypothetical protein
MLGGAMQAGNALQTTASDPTRKERHWIAYRFLLE